MKDLIRKYKISIVVLATAVSSFVSFSFVDDYFEVSKNLDIFSTLFREVNIYYVDSVDPGKLMKKGIDNMLEDLDPYTTYIPESDIQDYRFMTTGQYGGIGAVIRQKDDYVVISDPYEGFPAAKSGLVAGDYILEIDGKSTKGKRTDEVSRLLKGSPGTTVKLLIGRGSEKFEKALTREEIKVKSVPYYGMVSDSIGYIKLNSFTENCGRDVSTALKELKNSNQLKGLVFDLRGNPGGLLNEAVNVSNVFLERGTDIVSTKGKIKDLDKTYKTINDAVDKDIPVVVLVNSGSASASEIVSGSLQDLDRAVILGQRTYGKGLVQTTRPLSYNAQLKITTAKYYIPSGRCIQALDYSHRNEDGSVGKVPDSLMSPFKTKGGRTVYDGGGVLPDVVTDAKKLSNISSSLLSKNLIFDYATEFRRKNPTASSSISLSENDFNEFVNYISTKEYDYTTKSEKSLEDLKKNAEDEKYFSDLANEFQALKAKLSHNKQEDVTKNKKEIVNLLSEEIASRYYFQTGRIKQILMSDEEVAKAISILKDKKYYRDILSGNVKPETVKASK